jgi:hypothetical protein
LLTLPTSTDFAMTVPFELIAAHTAILLAPSIIALDRHTDLPHSFRRRPSLPLQHFNLSQFQHDIFGLLSLSSGFSIFGLLSFPSHPLVLLKSG